MDLKPSSWPSDPLPEALEPELADPAAHAPDVLEPRRWRRTARTPASPSEDLDELRLRLQSIGLRVGQG